MLLLSTERFISVVSLLNREKVQELRQLEKEYYIAKTRNDEKRFKNPIFTSLMLFFYMFCVVFSDVILLHVRNVCVIVSAELKQGL